MAAKIVKVSKNMIVLKTEYYFLGRKFRNIKVIFTEKYKRELEKKLQKYLEKSRSK